MAEPNGYRRWHSNVNWAAIGVTVTILVNVVIVVWHAAMTTKSTRDIAAHLQSITTVQARMIERQISADSALVAALNLHEVRIVRLEERAGVRP